MTDDPQKRIRLTDRKRSAIVKAAVAAFRENGFECTSMDRIAEAACVSKRTVYNHFPSKEDLFTEIVGQLTASCRTIGEFQFDPNESLAAQLTRIGQSAVCVAISPESRDLARVMLSRFLHAPELAREMLRGPKQYEAKLVEWIGAAQRAGRLQVDEPMRAVRQFLGLIHTFALWPQLIGGETPPDEGEQQAIVDAAVAMFLARYETTAPASQSRHDDETHSTSEVN